MVPPGLEDDMPPTQEEVRAKQEATRLEKGRQIGIARNEAAKKRGKARYEKLFGIGTLDQVATQRRAEKANSPENAEMGPETRKFTKKEIEALHVVMEEDRARTERIGETVEIQSNEGEPPIEGVNLGATEQGDTIAGIKTEDGPRFELVPEGEGSVQEKAEATVENAEQMFNKTLDVYLGTIDASKRDLIRSRCEREKETMLCYVIESHLDHNPEAVLLNRFKEIDKMGDSPSLSETMDRPASAFSTLLSQEDYQTAVKNRKNAELAAASLSEDQDDEREIIRLQALELATKKAFDAELDRFAHELNTNPENAQTRLKKYLRIEQRLLDSRTRVLEEATEEERNSSYGLDLQAEISKKRKEVSFLKKLLASLESQLNTSEPLAELEPTKPEQRFIALQPSELYSMGYDQLDELHTDLSKKFRELDEQIGKESDNTEKLKLKAHQDHLLDQIGQLTITKKIIGRKEDFLEAVERARAGDKTIDIDIEAEEFVDYLDEKMKDLESESPERLQLQIMRNDAEGYWKQKEALSEIGLEDDLSAIPERDPRDSIGFKGMVDAFRQDPVKAIEAARSTLERDDIDDTWREWMQVFYDNYHGFAERQAEMIALANNEEPAKDSAEMSPIARAYADNGRTGWIDTTTGRPVEASAEGEEVDYDTVEDDADEVQTSYASVDEKTGEPTGRTFYTERDKAGNETTYMLGERVVHKGVGGDGRDEMWKISSIGNENPPVFRLTNKDGLSVIAGAEEFELAQHQDAVMIPREAVEQMVGKEKEQEEGKRRRSESTTVVRADEDGIRRVDRLDKGIFTPEEKGIDELKDDTVENIRDREVTAQELRVARELDMNIEGLREFELITNNLTGPDASKEARQAAADHGIDFTWDDFMANDPSTARKIFTKFLIVQTPRQAMLDKIMGAYYQAIERGETLSVSGSDMLASQQQPARSVYQAGRTPTPERYAARVTTGKKAERPKSKTAERLEDQKAKPEDEMDESLFSADEEKAA